IGAGTITCNYDGANKSTTTIRDGAFIGSNTALVAPVVVGRDATIGAGSVITSDAPEGRLTIARGRQQTIEGWKRPVKAPKPAGLRPAERGSRAGRPPRGWPARCGGRGPRRSRG